jgi:hypothetical protein
MRIADTILNIIQDRGRLTIGQSQRDKGTGEPDEFDKSHIRFGGGCDPFSRNLERSKGMGDEGSLNL